jgi:manganese transport protein
MPAARLPPPDDTREPPRVDRRRLLAFLGPATLVSVGYMDPGNWATNLEGGARFGYQLLWVLVLSNLMALLLQTLAARLGIVSGLDLAGACRAHYSPRVSVALWLLAELAIVACDMAELLGSAVALNLLFGIPMLAGALLTVLDVFLILALERRGARTLEAAVAALVATIAVCLGVDLLLVRPALGPMGHGLVPRLSGASLYLAIGILGATVMPHNLYLHSALVRRREAAPPPAEQRRTLRNSFLGTALALNLALLVNAAILVLSAAVFAARGLAVTDLRQAYHLLAPILGTGLAATLFAVALLASGQSATVTGTLAGQIVMEGFVRLRVSPLARRAITRGLAVIPAVAVLAVAGEGGAMPLLVASQVVLSLQLPFAVVPLLRFTNARSVMGASANGLAVRLLAGACAAVVLVANGALVVHTIVELRARSSALAAVIAAAAFGALALLGWIAVAPLHRRPDESPVAGDAGALLAGGE